MDEDRKRENAVPVTGQTERVAKLVGERAVGDGVEKRGRPSRGYETKGEIRGRKSRIKNIKMCRTEKERERTKQDANFRDVTAIHPYWPGGI